MDFSIALALLLFFASMAVAATPRLQSIGFAITLWIVTILFLIWLIYSRRQPIAMAIGQHPIVSSLLVAAAVASVVGIGFHRFAVSLAPNSSISESKAFGDDQYRDLVASLIQSFDSKASIAIGNAIIGPDGFRRVDIEVRSSDKKLVAVDVLDYPNGKKATVEDVDRADSKRRDIQADAMILCSNTGFDDLAITKAKRVHVGLLSAIKGGDDRIKAIILEEVYLRKIKITDLTFTFDGNTEADGDLLRRSVKGAEDVLYKGSSVIWWMQGKVMLFGMVHSEVNKPIRWSFALKQPTIFTATDQPVTLKSMSVQFTQNVQWLAQTVQIEASSGIYDYVNQRLLLTPGPMRQFTMRDANFDTATPLPSAPAGVLMGKKFVPGMVDMQLAKISGLSMPADGSKVPALDDLIDPNDLRFDIDPETNATP